MAKTHGLLEDYYARAGRQLEALQHGRRSNRLLAAQNREIEKQRLALAGANVELTIRATTDALTGFANRAAALATINSLLADAAQKRSCVALAIDIDHFKRVNDNYGHLAGDEVLRQVAHALYTALSDAPVVARIGGEEFLVCLSEQDPAQVATQLEIARRAVAARRAIAEQVTISVGWVMSVPALGVDELLGAADRSLYRAKAMGRDRVEFAATPCAPEAQASATV